MSVVENPVLLGDNVAYTWWRISNIRNHVYGIPGFISNSQNTFTYSISGCFGRIMSAKEQVLYK